MCLTFRQKFKGAYGSWPLSSLCRETKDVLDRGGSISSELQRMWAEPWLTWDELAAWEINFDVAASHRGCQIVAIYITPSLADSEFLSSCQWNLSSIKYSTIAISIMVLMAAFYWTLELSPKYSTVIKPHLGLRIKALYRWLLMLSPYNSSLKCTQLTAHWNNCIWWILL